MSPVWLTHLVASEGGAAAHRRAEGLGPDVHAELVATADRFASSSAVLAQRCYAHAAAAWQAFGPPGFRRWCALGHELATGTPRCVEGALAYYAVAPAAFGQGGLAVAAAWCDLARQLARRSARLAATFLEQTPAVLVRADALPRLHAWVAAGLGLHDTPGWRGGAVAHVYFRAEADVVVALAPEHYDLWAKTRLVLAAAVRESTSLTCLPPGVASWTDAERASFLELVLRFATAAPESAASCYRSLPLAVARLDPASRAALLATLGRFDAASGPEVATVTPVLGAIVETVPAVVRTAALGLVSEIVERSSAAGLAALRSLPRLYEEAQSGGIERWFRAGLAIAVGNPAAGRAFFALESRTSLAVLRAGSTAATLDETQAVWRRLIQMLSGQPAGVRVQPGVSLRPLLEECPAENEIALPERIDWRPTHEENYRLFRVLAAVLAGRREFGTYAFMPSVDRAEGSPPGTALTAFLRGPDQPALLEELFLLADGVRIHHRLAVHYPGLAADLCWAATCVLERAAREDSPALTLVLDTLLALAVGGTGDRPAWLSADVASAVRSALAPLAAPSATVAQAMAIARRLAASLTLVGRARSADAEPVPFSLADIPLVPDETAVPEGGEAPTVASFPGDAADDADVAVDLAAPADELPGMAVPLAAEELARLLEAGVRPTQATGDGGGGSGLFVTQLKGKLPSALREESRDRAAESAATARRPRSVARGEDTDPCYFYDEWDELIGDYRSRWCRLYERELPGDGGEFFTRTVAANVRLIPEVRRQFQRIRPAMYRPLSGLEDGEDFDLNAVIDAWTDRRARRPPSTRLYRSRVRAERDVATLFLLDMSASTDEPLVGASAPGPARRTIDVVREALVVMAVALEELGDAYAIYGFSGEGRAKVEFYHVKGFSEPLARPVKARIGGITPKGSTRMGTALRHATTKLRNVAARSRHLLLLSDGFPQDLDYGEDRRSHAYGIRDTAAALREAETAGITPFCVTVDRAGHDYLREMCDTRRYMVIDDTAALPRELPKIYEREILSRVVPA